jgi:sugar lactone lactonase YvrE
MAWEMSDSEGIPEIRVEVVAGGEVGNPNLRRRFAGHGLHHLYHPHGISMDVDGTLLISDRQNHRILAWPDGATQGAVVAGRCAGCHDGCLHYPEDVTADATGFYVANSECQNILFWSHGAHAGRLVAGSGSRDRYGERPEDLHSPASVAEAPNGDLLIADDNNHRFVRWRVVEEGGFELWQATVVAGGRGRGTELHQLYYPSGLAVDGRNIYVSDEAHRVTRWRDGDESGVLVAGGRGSGAGLEQLQYPRGLAVLEGTLYVSDKSNHRVMAWPFGAAEGAVVAAFAGSGSGLHQLSSPEDIVIDDGDLYVIDGNHRAVVWRGVAGENFTAPIKPVTLAGMPGRGSGKAQLHLRWGGVAIDNGDVYVSDHNNHRVMLFGQHDRVGFPLAGGYGQGVGLNQLSYPEGICVSNGLLYVADRDNHRVMRWTPGAAEGAVVAGFHKHGDKPWQLYRPRAVHVVGKELYVSERDNHRVTKWSMLSEPFSPAVVAGESKRHGATSSRFYGAEAVFVTAGGDMYVADHYNHRVMKYATGARKGVVVAGGRGPGDQEGQLHYPMDVFVTEAGDVYVAERNSHCVSKWTVGATAGITVAGTRGTYSTALTHLYEPHGVRVVIDEHVDYVTTNVTNVTSNVTTFVTQRIVISTNTTIYVSDRRNSRIVAWEEGATEGTVVAGEANGQSGNGLHQLQNPRKFDVNVSSRALLIADEGNHRIVQWEAGATSGAIRAGGDSYSHDNDYQFAHPADAKFGVEGQEFYVVDSSNHRILRFDGSDQPSQYASGARRRLEATRVRGAYVAGFDSSHFAASGHGQRDYQLDTPRGLHISAHGTIFVADMYNYRIVAWRPRSAEGFVPSIATVVAGWNGYGSNSNQFRYPYGVAADADGNVFIADEDNHRIMKWAPGAQSGSQVAGYNHYAGHSLSSLYHPRGLALHSSGALFIADSQNNRVLKWYPGQQSGSFAAGAQEWRRRTPRSLVHNLDRPTAVALDETSLGNNALYVADGQDSDRVVKWYGDLEAELIPSAWVGSTNGRSSGYGNHQLHYPMAHHVDPLGNLYVADTSNHRVMKYCPTCNHGSLVAGRSNEAGHGLDRLYDPKAVWFYEGSVYVADYHNHRVTAWAASSSAGVLVAGTGNSGRALDQLNGPTGLVVVNGSLFVSDCNNHRVMRWELGASEGSVVAGQTSAYGRSSSKLYYPQGLAVRAGAVYVADSENDRVVKWEEGASEGKVVAGFGGRGQGMHQLNRPHGVHVTGDGTVFVADTDNHRISKWQPESRTGALVSAWGGREADSGDVRAWALYDPRDVYVTADGTVTVSDRHNHRIAKYSPSPNPSSGAALALTPVIFAGGTGTDGLAALSSPAGLHVETGTVYVADTNHQRIVAIAPGGRDVRLVAGSGRAGEELSDLSYPYAVAVVDGAIVYVSDTGNHRVMRWSAGSAEGTVIAGFRGTGSGLEQLHTPRGLLVTKGKDVLVCDEQNHRVMKYSPNPDSLSLRPTVLFGGSYGHDVYSLYTPSAVFAALSGDVYVADENNHRVLAFADNGAYSRVVAGGHGGGHASHQLYSPQDVALDSSGQIYVVDYHNHRVSLWPAENAPERAADYAGENYRNEHGVLEAAVAAGWHDGTTGGSRRRRSHGGHGTDRLYYPRALQLVEADGVVDIYVVERNNHRVTRWSVGAKQGEVVAGGHHNHGHNLDQLYYPEGVAVGADRTVYVSDSNNHRVTAWAPGSSEPDLAAGRLDSNGHGQAGSSMDQLYHPQGLRIASDGSLVIADMNNHRIVSWAPGATEGTFTAGFGNGGSGSQRYKLASPRHVDVTNGELLIADTGNHRIMRWSETAAAVDQGGFSRPDASVFAGGNGAGSALSQLDRPSGITQYEGSIYISDQNHRVMRWEPGETAGSIAAGFNGAGNSLAQLSSPRGLVVVKGELYIADEGNSRVLRWSPGATQGVLLAGFNGHGNEQHQLNSPRGVYADEEAIHVVDTGNHRVMRWSLVDDLTTCTLGAPMGRGVLHDCSGTTFNESCSAFCSSEWSGAVTEFVCEAGGIFYGEDPTCNPPTPAPTPSPTIHARAGENACELDASIDPENLCVVDQNGHASVDHDSQSDPQLSLTITAKGASHLDFEGALHGATSGDIIDERATDSRYVIACPQAAGEKTVKFTVSRPKEISAFGAEWLMLFPKDSWRNITCEFEPWTYNAFGSKIPLFRAVSNELADDAAEADDMAVYMEVSRRGDFEVRYGNPNMVFEGNWLASEFRSSLLRVGSPWADCGLAEGDAGSPRRLGAILPALYGHPYLDGGEAKYAQLVAGFADAPNVTVYVVLEVFHAGKNDWTSSAHSYGTCYKVGNECPERHAVCKAEYCEIDRFAKIIAELKAAGPSVHVLASVDTTTSFREYTEAGLDVDGAYFSDPAAVHRSLKLADKVPFSVVMLGTPLFDFDAVEKADVFVTFAGNESDLGAWTPYSWYPDQDPTKFAAVVAQAADVAATTTALLDRGYGYVFVTSEMHFSTPPAETAAVLETLASHQGRRLQALPPSGNRDTFSWGCDDTLLECRPVCFKTRGRVMTRVADARCGDLTRDECSCKCYFDAEWRCVDSSVVCSVRESGTFVRRTVGDGVCTSRGTDKPSYEELTSTGVCEPLPTERGSSPPVNCEESPPPTRVRPRPAPLLDDASAAFSLAVAALACMFM